MLTWGGANDLSQPSFANVTMLGWCRVPRECLNDLSRQPVRRRMSGYREPQQLPPAMADDENANKHSNVSVGTTQRSIAAMASA